MTPTGRKRPSSGAILTSSVATKGPIKVPRINNNNNKPSNFKEFLKETLREFALGIVIKDCKTIEEEFTTIRTDMIYDSCSKTKIAFDSHSDKNRYQDVICIDKTRVRLAYPPGAGSDYIHANYVMGHDDEMRFICTQGPKENTVNDFWRMVWQEKCKSIVMLCNVMELSKKKCEKYWPDEGIPLKLPSNLTIYFIKKDEVEPHLVVTRLKVENEAGESLELEHIQWKDWPDRGVPVASMAPFRLLTRLQNLTPSVVHCSAGIGRSGTIIGLDLAYNRLLSGQVASMDSIVRELREQRHGSVQTDVQYLYMHRLLLLLAEDKGAVTAEELAPFLQQYDQWTNSKY